MASTLAPNVKLPRRDRGDQIFDFVLRICAVIGILIIIGITLLFISNSTLSLQRFGLSFFTGTLWDIPNDVLGSAAFIYGTTITSIIALILALPLALGAALFVSEYAPRWLGTPVAFIVELLVTIPSVAYGLWGMAVLIPLMRDKVEPFLRSTLGPVPLLGPIFFKGSLNGGRNLLTAGIILAIMILPTILSISREVITQVPRLQKEGMLALGATKWEAIRHAILPYARGGIVGAALLGLARALGETMAVLMVGGNGPTNAAGVNTSLFSAGATIASKIAGGATESTSALSFSGVIELGLALLLVASVFNIIARQYVKRINTSLPK